MVHLFLFWIGIVLAAILVAVTASTRFEEKTGTLVAPFTFLVAAAVAKYLGM